MNNGRLHTKTPVTESSSLLPSAISSNKLKLRIRFAHEEVKHQDLRVLPALAIGVFLAAADQTIVVSSYGRIGSELNALNSMSWLATGYDSVLR